VATSRDREPQESARSIERAGRLPPLLPYFSGGNPCHRTRQEYTTALKAAKFLVIAHGTADEVANAKSIIETIGAAQVAAHQA
jgi:hypothetical protein